MSPGQMDISRDRWDVSPGQTGRTPGGVPPKFFMFIGFFFFPKEEMLPNRSSWKHNAPNMHVVESGLTAWRGAVSGWTSPQSSGRKFFPKSA